MTSSRVLVTDGSMKHTLAAVRSLGRRGLYVTVVDESLLAESFYSKYCQQRRLTAKRVGPEEYVLQLKSILKKIPHDVLLPISWRANYYVAKYRHHLEGLVNLAIPDFRSMEIAGYKDQTMDFAKKQGLDIPETIPLETTEDLHRAIDAIGYPMVLKGSAEGGTVRYVRSYQELEEAYSRLRHDRPIAQQYIEGDGVGFFAAYNKGKCIARFMHKRVREYPRSGGPSTAAQSIYSPELAKQGMKLLDALHWHGVAMVEFKHSPVDGKFYLMEINPKFWGSLDLSIKAGMDFPFIAYNIALGNAESVKQMSYRQGVLFRWPFPGEFLYALDTGEYSSFIRNFFKPVYVDDIRISDPVPLLLQLVSTIRKMRGRMSS
ncbi:MAG: ATP-grasp domain-containing protein [Promethearchaeota archaeon]